jgi:hypothetical protein
MMRFSVPVTEKPPLRVISHDFDFPLQTILSSVSVFTISIL